jgi:hypothetical protein
MSKTIQIPIEDVEDLVAVLHLTMSAYQGHDVADSYNNLQQTVKYRPLTIELVRLHERMSGFLKDYLFDEYQEEDTDAEEE